MQLVSALDGSTGSPVGANGDSQLPIITPDGRYVLFASAGNNLILSNGGTELHPLNVYRRDRSNGMTTLVSVNLNGTGGNGSSVPTGISTNGQYVLFESDADDLVPGDSNKTSDVFVRDMVNSTLALVSVSTNGVAGNGLFRNSTISPDGRYVAFVSEAKNLVANDTNGISDIFVRDRQAGTTTLASIGAMTTGSLTFISGCESPQITPDGRFVAFYSSATNLVPGLSLAGEVYVRDLIAGTTTWASTNGRSLFQSIYGTTNTISCDPVISADGRYIGFEVCSNTAALNPVGPNNRGIALRYDLTSGATDMVATNASVPVQSFADIDILDLTPDGRFVTYVANANGSTAIYLWDAQTGTNILVSADQGTGLAAVGVADAPIVNPTGQYVAFTCTATNLVVAPLGTPGSTHLYLRDVTAGVTRLIDVDTNGVGAGVDAGVAFAMTADGQSVAFDSENGTLVTGDRNGESDIFVRDWATNITEMISVHDPALASSTVNRFSHLSLTSVNNDGRYVAFATEANNLTDRDGNRCYDIYVRDLVLGTNILVTGMTNGFTGTNSSFEPAITPDGRYVAFSSYSSMLATNDFTSTRQVLVRDLQVGNTILISAIFGSHQGGSQDSYSPAISTNGQFVLFRSKAGGLALGGGVTAENLYFRDIQLATNYALTTASSGTSVFPAAMTPDGRYVVFGNPNLCLWDSQVDLPVYTNTLIAPTNLAISADGHWAAYIANAGLNVFDLVNKTNQLIGTWAGGFRGPLQFDNSNQFLLFVTKGNVVPADTNGQYDVYLYNMWTGTKSLVSQSYNSTNAAKGVSDSAVISADGRFVAYRSGATNIVPNDTNARSDVFLYDRINNATTLVSVNQTQDSSANSGSGMPVFSGDGGRLLFESYASDLPGPGYNEFSSIYALNLSAAALVDSDGDGMDDQWELDHFGTLANDGTGDFDGDGASDLFEFLTGTNPTDPASIFRATITGTLTAGQSPVIDWPLVPGQSYRVQYKDDLAAPAWQDVNNRAVFIGGRGRITDLTPPAGQRFYRIILTN